jgi:uncharacterized protein
MNAWPEPQAACLAAARPSLSQSSASSTHRLLVSIHDVSPCFQRQIDFLYDQLSNALNGSRLAMLVVPNFWRRAPIAEAPYFIQKLRRWADAGVEMMLHGWVHRDDQKHARAGNAFKARYLTAGEGEFLGLSRSEAVRRLRDGRRALEDATGRPVNGFVAPAWLYSPGTLEALGEHGFRIAEDHWRVWDPATGERLAFAPVITWASRSKPRTAASLARIAPALLEGFDVARLAVHPGDVAVPAIRTSIERTLGALMQSRTTIRYADLATARRAEVAGVAA